MRADKIMGLANSVLGGNRGEAIKLIAKGAQMWRDPNAKPEEAAKPDPAAAAGQAPAQPGQPGQPQPGQPQPGQPAGYGAPPAQQGQPAGYGAPPAHPGHPAQHAPQQAAQPAAPADNLEPDEWAILRIMAAAAQADGVVAPHEQNTILTQANKLGASPQQMQQLNYELQQKVSVAEIVQSVDSVAARKLMYQFAFAMVKSDHQVTQQEMAFLTELAKVTELSHEVLGQLVR